MTTFLKTHASAIEAFKKSSDYSGLCNLFVREEITSRDLTIFYKSKKKEVFRACAFWNSDLPLLLIEEILESDLRVAFMHEYVSKDVHCNNGLNRQLLSLDPQLFLRLFKLSGGHKKIAFLTDFENLRAEFSILGRLPQELKVIATTIVNLEASSKVDDQFLLQIPFGKVLITFALFHYEMKQMGRIEGNRVLQVAEEVALVNELNDVIQLFKNAGKIDSDSLPFESDEELQRYFDSYCVPHHILGKSNQQLFDAEIALVRDVLYRKIERLYVASPLEIYLSGFAEFENPTFPPYKLVTNERFKLFQQNDKKSVPEEMYLSGLSIAQFDVNQLSRTRTTGPMNYFEMYGVPRHIEHDGHQVDLKQVISVLKHFSTFKGPVERNFNPSGVMEMNRGDELFVKLFGSNSCICLFNEDELKSAVAMYFKIDDVTAGGLLDFLTLDLAKPLDLCEWIQSPFLKIRNKIIWMGTLSKDRRWEVILTNRLKSCEPYKTQIPKNVETSVAELFKKRGYFVLNSHQFHSTLGTKGDIDVLALKDDALFIIEVKAGQHSNDFKHAAYSELVRLEGSAAEQLAKIEDYIRADWDILKGQLGKWKYKKLEELKIYSLIVTDHFEGELQLYKEKYLKTSILELDVILSNGKKRLYENYLILNTITNPNNPMYRGGAGWRIEWSLWKNKLTPRVLYECIASNSVWKELNEEWKFVDQVFYVD